PSTSIWEIETGESIATCQLDGDHPRALAPTGTRMAIEQDGRVVIWDTVGCRALTELSGWQKDKSNSYSVMFSADATLVATSGDNLRSEEHTSELQSRENLVCRLLLEKKKKRMKRSYCKPTLKYMLKCVWLF